MMGRSKSTRQIVVSTKDYIQDLILSLGVTDYITSSINYHEILKQSLNRLPY
jgi:hypothetical protein